MIWLTSDWHLGHQRIIDLAQRPFDSVEEMNETLIANHNAVVGPKDTTYFLGDMIMGGWKGNIHLIDRLAGTKILVVGNHDAPFIKWGKPAFEDVMARYLEHFDEVTFQIDDMQGFTLSHFPYDGDNHEGDRYKDRRPVDVGVHLLHGHTHSDQVITRSEKGTLQFHVGVDAHQFRPVALPVIREIIHANTGGEIW